MAQPHSLSSVPKTHTVEGKDPTPSVYFWPRCVCCGLCACTQSIHTISEEIFLRFFVGGSCFGDYSETEFHCSSGCPGHFVGQAGLVLVEICLLDLLSAETKDIHVPPCLAYA